MQPRYTQTPPGFSSGSTSAVLRPRSAARNAAAYPPGPAPMTTTWVEVMRRERLEKQDGLDGQNHPARPAPPAPPASSDVIPPATAKTAARKPSPPRQGNARR